MSQSGKRKILMSSSRRSRSLERGDNDHHGQHNHRSARPRLSVFSRLGTKSGPSGGQSSTSVHLWDDSGDGWIASSYPFGESV